MIYRPAIFLIAGLALTPLAGCAPPILKLLPRVGHKVWVAEYYAVNNAGNSAYSKGDYQTAVAEYSKLIAMRPQKFDGYSLRGMAYYQMGMYSKSAADDTQAISVVSTPAGISEIGYDDQTARQQQNNLPSILSSLYVGRGMAYHEMGRDASAVADYASAFANDPSTVDAHGARAEAYVNLKQFANAVSDCTIEIKNHPTKWQLYYVRGKAYAGLGNLKAARADLITASQYDHGNEPTVELNVKVLDDIHDNVGAAQVEQVAALRNPDNAHALGSYGWRQYLAGDIKGAIVSDLKASALPDTPLWVHANLALCYAMQGDWKKANPEYALEKADPDSSMRQGAVDDIQNALKQQPNNATLKKALAFMTAA